MGVPLLVDAPRFPRLPGGLFSVVKPTDLSDPHAEMDGVQFDPFPYCGIPASLLQGSPCDGMSSFLVEASIVETADSVYNVKFVITPPKAFTFAGGDYQVFVRKSGESWGDPYDWKPLSGKFTTYTDSDEGTPDAYYGSPFDVRIDYPNSVDGGWEQVILSLTLPESQDVTSAEHTASKWIPAPGQEGGYLEASSFSVYSSASCYINGGDDQAERAQARLEFSEEDAVGRTVATILGNAVVDFPNQPDQPYDFGQDDPKLFLAKLEYYWRATFENGGSFTGYEIIYMGRDTAQFLLSNGAMVQDNGLFFTKLGVPVAVMPSLNTADGTSRVYISGPAWLFRSPIHTSKYQDLTYNTENAIAERTYQFAVCGAYALDATGIMQAPPS